MSASCELPKYTMDLFPPGSKHRVGRSDVPDASLDPVREQVSFQMRRRSEDPEAEIPLIEQPQFGDEKTVEGIRFVAGDGAAFFESVLGLEPFQYYAEHWASELVANKTLTESGTVRFKVFTSPPRDEPASSPGTARVVRRRLPFCAGQMSRFLALAQPCGPQREDDYPVFVLEDALQQAEQLATGNPDVEGGAWLVGNLFHQRLPQPEIFGVVHTVLGVQGAEQKRDSLSFSSSSYFTAQETLMRRRVQLGREGELVFGLYHTHPFLPSLLEDRDSCAQCKLVAECKATSSFFSQQDAVFHRAVFGRAAYAVQMVLGLTPRREPDLKMFSFDGGLFRERGYYRLSRMPSVVPRSASA